MKVYQKSLMKHQKTIPSVNKTGICYLPVEVLHYKVEKSLWDKGDSRYKKIIEIKKGEVVTRSIVLGHLHPISFSFEYIEKHSGYGNGQDTDLTNIWYIEIEKEDLKRLEDTSLNWIRELIKTSKDILEEYPEDVVLGKWINDTLPLFEGIPSFIDVL